MRWKCEREASKEEEEEASFLWISFTNSLSLSWFRMFFLQHQYHQHCKWSSISNDIHFYISGNFFFSLSLDEKSPLWCCLVVATFHLLLPSNIFIFMVRKVFFLVHSIFNPTRNSVMDCTNCCCCCCSPAVYILYNNMPKIAQFYGAYKNIFLLAKKKFNSNLFFLPHHSVMDRCS